MDRVYGVAAGGVQNAVDIEIAFRGGRCADVGGFVGFADVQRGTIRVGINGDGADIHLTQGADDAERDLAAIRDQNL